MLEFVAQSFPTTSRVPVNTIAAMYNSLVSIYVSSKECSSADPTLRSDASILFASNSSYDLTPTANVSLDASLVSSLTSTDSDGKGDRRDPVECLGNDPSLRQPLYDGTEVSTWDSYLLIMKYALRHSLSKQAVSDLLNLVALHLPKKSTISLYKMKKLFLNLYEDITHYCCSGCHSPYSDRDTTCPNSCDSASAEFLTISVGAQLKRSKLI